MAANGVKRPANYATVGNCPLIELVELLIAVTIPPTGGATEIHWRAPIFPRGRERLCLLVRID
jgi:hypothetical protein